MNAEVHEQIPPNFAPQVQVAACYLEVEGKLLLLQKTSGTSEPGKWSVPAGKMEENETPEQAAIRELFEETGITIENSSQMQPLRPLYIRKPRIDYVFHLFKVHLKQIPEVHLSDEHQSYRWVALEEIEKLPLMDGGQQALQHYRKEKKNNGS